MRIAMFSDFYPPYGGGAEISTFLESLKLAKEGIEVNIITRRFKNDCSIEKVAPNLTIFRIPTFSQRINENYPFATYLSYKFFQFEIPKIIPLLNKIKPDLLHIQNAEVSLSKLKRRLPSKVVVTIRDSWVLCPCKLGYIENICCVNCSIDAMLSCTIKNRLINSMKGNKTSLSSLAKSIYYSALVLPHIYFLSNVQINKLKYLEKYSDRIITISKYIKNQVICNSKLSASKIEVIYPFLPQYSLIPYFQKNKTIFAFIGRLDYSKGIINLIEAFLAARKQNKNIKLLIFGSGPLLDFVKINSNRIDSGIEYKGTFNQSIIKDVFIQTDVIIIPSLTPEAFGRVCAEAMLHGKVVMVNPVGGLAEQVNDEVTGFYADCYNTDALASKIIELANLSFDELSKIGQNAHNYASKNFNAQISIKKLVRLYEDIIS